MDGLYGSGKLVRTDNKPECVKLQQKCEKYEIYEATLTYFYYKYQT